MRTNCEDKLSNICNDPINAKCVDYRGQVSENSTLVTQCPTQHEVDEDMYKLLDKLFLGTEVELPHCLDYSNSEGSLTIGKILKAHAQEVCDMKVRIQQLERLLLNGEEGSLGNR